MTIKQKIQELVPDVLIRTVRIENGFKEKVGEIDLVKDITLAMVLRAIDKEMDQKEVAFEMQSDGYMWTEPVGGGAPTSEAWWDLTQDFDGQESKTKAFIGKLLGVTPTI